MGRSTTPYRGNRKTLQSATETGAQDYNALEDYMIIYIAL